ncbi:MAG: glycosyltransferase family 4 protein [Anaerolineae bacterium]|jgi:glycosyltransferase involved in cell wall biosynthesis
MHVLFISRWFPYPPDNGSKIRIFNLIRQLSKRHAVTLLSFSQGAVSRERMANMKAFCRAVHAIPYRGFNPGGLKALMGFFSPRPRFIVDTYHPEMEALIQEVAAQNDFDAVIASEIDTALYALLLDLPRVLEDIEVTVIREQFTRQRRLLSKARYGLTWFKLTRFITRLLREYDGCTTVSERERELLSRIAPGYDSWVIIPNGVDLEVNSGNFGKPVPDTLIYPGALTYSANFDAMQFFLRDVFPLIQAQRPGASLRITGGYDGVPVQELPLGRGAELTGYLDDIRPAVAQSWACVIPLQIGGGTRLKILEAMALGTPVVSTSKGAEGLAATPERDILIADSPGDFAQAVLRLLKDRDLRARLSSNGRRLVEEHYAWEACARPLEELLYRAVGHEGARDG